MIDSKIEHTTIRNQKLFCMNCGGEDSLPVPIAINDMSKKIDAFNQLHGSCAKTWTEPEANHAETVHQRALWWIENGEVGMSSKTIWNFFMSGSNKPFPINHPHDIDDFSRCYKLLKAIPEWRKELARMKPLSKEWNNLVGNWDKLTEMYENIVRTNWKTSEKIGMYEFMKSLTH